MNSFPGSTNTQQGASFNGVDFDIRHISGKVEIGNTTQNIYQQHKPDFFELSLDRYTSANFKSPQITTQLLNRIKNQRLLILAGSSDVDKDSLAKHTASCLIDRVLRSPEIIAKEWYRSSDPQSIDIEIRKAEKSTVFILTQITPQNVGYNLIQLQESAVAGNCYVIVSTDMTFAAWKQPNKAKVWWYELSRQSVFDSPQLISNLSREDALSVWYYQQLEPREQLLVLGLSFFDGLFEDQFFAALEEIVEQVWQRRDASLRALDYCDLENLHTFFSFTETQDSGTKITIRFPKQRRILFRVAWKSHRRQILSALPVMVNIVINSVSGQWTNSELYGTSAKCKDIRTAIAETISDLGSISENAIQTTLLQLCAHNNPIVQSTAAYAMGRWRDSDYSLDRQLFERLHLWLDVMQARRIIEQVNAIVEGRKQENNESLKAENYVKATVALTVGYAALYDPPRAKDGSGGLSEELFALLKKLGDETSTVVRDTFLNYTLPKVLQIHLSQLSGWLHDIISQQNSSSSSNSSIFNFNHSVGVGLALTYANLPKETAYLLADWKNEALKTECVGGLEVTSRESLLATVALTYGEIDCGQHDSDVLSHPSIINLLSKLLQTEKHLYVRTAALFAIGRQVSLYFEKVEEKLKDLMTQLKPDECDYIVDILSRIYFKQRINLPGGDYWSSKKSIKIGEVSYSYRYPIWVNEQRPLTAIEEAMYNWIQDARSNDARPIALRSLVAFANFIDRDEIEEKDKISTKLEAKASDRDFDLEAPIVKNHFQDIYVKHIVPWLTVLLKWVQYFLFKKEYHESLVSEWTYYRKTILSTVLPETIKQNSSSQPTMDLVIKRLAEQSEKKLKVIADLLKLAIPIAKNPGLVIVGVAILAIVFIGLLPG